MAWSGSSGWGAWRAPSWFPIWPPRCRGRPRGATATPSGCRPTSTPPASWSSPRTSGPRSNAASSSARASIVFFRGWSVARPASADRRPAALERDRHRRLGQHRHLSSHPAGSGVSGQAGPVDRVRGARGDARQRCRGQPRPGHRPLHDPDLRPQANPGPGPQPALREWSRAAQPDGYPDRIEWTPSGQGGYGSRRTGGRRGPGRAGRLLRART